jgi:hypothetical protein
VVLLTKRDASFSVDNVDCLSLKILLLAYSNFWVYFSIVWQWEFVFALWAFCHVALYYGWAGSAGEGSAVAYVESEVAFWTAYNMFCLSHEWCHYGYCMF